MEETPGVEPFDLDDQAHLALDVARHAALANGDAHCGTEYLLYGLVATARADVAELTELFALNTMRVDRAIERLLEQRQLAGVSLAGPPQLSIRATQALQTPRIDGGGPTGPFELLHGLLADDASGACRVLTDLGVAPDEVRRLVSYGLRHLTKAEVDDLIAALDRRDGLHQPWWGPGASSRLRSLAPGSGRATTVAESSSARIELSTVATDGGGLGFTLTTRSLRPWVLPPVFVPEESLVPGQGARYVDGPDFFLLRLSGPDGPIADNRAVHDRFSVAAPVDTRLIRLGQREERTTMNDRRQPDQTIVTVDWWVWPAPAVPYVEIAVDWPAESTSGEIRWDTRSLYVDRP